MSKMVCLNGSNYHIWKGKMKDLLFVKKMHLYVLASNKPDSINDEDLEFEHLKCAPNKRMYWQIINLQQIVSMRAAHTSFSRSLICVLQQLKSNKLNGVKYLPV